MPTISKNLIPAAVAEEFKSLLKSSRGFEAKRAAARKRVYARLVARYGAPWWSQNCEALKNEMTNIEKETLCQTK